MEKYKIKIVTTSLNQYHCEIMDDVLSGASSIVVGTDTMSVEDWIRANEFSTCVQSFHHFGIMQCIAMYIRKEKNISYYDFYSALHKFIEEESTFCKPLFEMVSKVLRDFVDGKGGLVCQNDIFGKITYPLEEMVFLCCLYDSEKFYEEMRIFVKRFIDDEKILDELFRYQMSVVLRPQHNDYAINFAYKFKDYFDAILCNSYIPLEKEDIIYKFFTPFETPDWVEYAKEIIWYGRRNGRMMFSSQPNKIEEI